jgi:hypothetical protein
VTFNNGRVPFESFVPRSPVDERTAAEERRARIAAQEREQQEADRRINEQQRRLAAERQERSDEDRAARAQARDLIEGWKELDLDEKAQRYAAAARELGVRAARGETTPVSFDIQLALVEDGIHAFAAQLIVGFVSSAITAAIAELNNKRKP